MMKDKKEKSAFELVIEATGDPEKKEELKLINYEDAKEAEKEINKLTIDKGIKKLIITGDYLLTSSAEERDFKIHKALIKSRYDTPTILSIFINPHLGCSDEKIKGRRD